jgi:ATP-dependent RNA helicase DDX23/PRP28
VREDFDIHIKGGRAPNPLRNWKEGHLGDSIMRAITDMGYKEPSPIQRQAIPIGMKHGDVIGIAETGSGKTAAFIIPMIHYIEKLGPVAMDQCDVDGPLAIIMAPTRELALQIEQEAIKLCKYVTHVHTHIPICF